MGACNQCGRELKAVEIALTKKLVNRGAKAFFCLTCLSSKFKVPETLLLEKAEEYKKSGCVLFP